MIASIGKDGGQLGPHLRPQSVYCFKLRTIFLLAEIRPNLLPVRVGTKGFGVLLMELSETLTKMFFGF